MSTTNPTSSEAELDAAAALIQAAASSYTWGALAPTPPKPVDHVFRVAGLVVQPDSSLMFAVKIGHSLHPHQLTEGTIAEGPGRWEDDDDPPLEAFGGAKLLRTFACCPFMLALIGYLMSLDYTLFALLLLVAAALAAFFSAASESCGRSLRDIELPQFFCRPAQRAGRQRDERAP